MLCDSNNAYWSPFFATCCFLLKDGEKGSIFEKCKGNLEKIVKNLNDYTTIFRLVCGSMRSVLEGFFAPHL